MSQAMITLEKFFDVWVLHLEITDQHLMRRGVDMREKTFGDAVLAMVDKYAEFVPDDPSVQGLLEMLTGSPRREPPDEPAPKSEVHYPEPHSEPEVSLIDEEEADLRELAEGLGVHVDGRWGAARLREEIAKAQE